jgi:hypothetical protein
MGGRQHDHQIRPQLHNSILLMSQSFDGCQPVPFSTANWARCVQTSSCQICKPRVSRLSVQQCLLRLLHRHLLGVMQLLELQQRQPCSAPSTVNRSSLRMPQQVSCTWCRLQKGVLVTAPRHEHGRTQQRIKCIATHANQLSRWLLL